jgi:hypothetical protein
MALWAAAFSLLGFTCMWGFGGILAIAFGVMSRAEIERSQGQKRGARLALAAIALGSLNVVVCVLALGVGITLLARPAPHSPPSKAPPLYTTPALPPPAPAPTALAGSSAPKSSAGSMSRDTGLVVTRIGKVDLVDVGPDVHSLSDELDKQREIAGRDGKRLMLWVVQANCQPCNGVSAALPESGMQSALSHVRLVRVDPQDFGLELRQFNIPTDKIPGFALLGPDNHPLDYINGGEWDEDVAANIAPVLRNFVRGTYKARRDPWRGGARDDETPL